MNDFPDNKPNGKEDLEKTVVLRPDEDDVVDAEYLDDPEEEQVDLDTTPPETWPSLGEDEQEEGDGIDSAGEETAYDEEETEQEPSAAPVDKPKNMRWDTMFLLLLTSITLIRLGYLYIVPLDLIPDESYYWDWSRTLDLGYFGQPPLIAWINAASTALLGISTQAVRIPAVIFGAIGLIGMYLCGRRMFNAEVGFWGVAAWLATPGAAVLGLIMVPDVLLIGCWCLALYTLWRTLDAAQPNPFWWLLTMLLVGLGSLGSQMMLTFPLLMILYLLCSEDRKHLKRRWPWFLWLGSLLFLIPTLWWNFSNGWATFKPTAQHLDAASLSSFDRVKTFGDFLVGQISVLTPITWLLLLFLCLALLFKLLRWSRQTKFLFIFCAIGLFGFAGYSLKQEISLNWPATYYPAGLLLLAAWGKEHISAGFFDRLRGWFTFGVKFGIILTLVAYLLPFAMQLSFIPMGKLDPTLQGKGWQELAQQVDRTLHQQPRPEQTFILSPARDYTAEIAFYASGNPRTYQWSENPQGIGSQYNLWSGPTDKLGWDALILHAANTPLPAGLTSAFENIFEIGEQSISIGAAGERKYTLWRGENLLSWPEGQ